MRAQASEGAEQLKPCAKRSPEENPFFARRARWRREAHCVFIEAGEGRIAGYSDRRMARRVNERAAGRDGILEARTQEKRHNRSPTTLRVQRSGARGLGCKYWRTRRG